MQKLDNVAPHNTGEALQNPKGVANSEMQFTRDGVPRAEPLREHREGDRLLREPEVLKQIPISSSTLKRRMRERRFPKPVRLGPNSIAWRQSDLDAYIADPEGWAAANADG